MIIVRLQCGLGNQMFQYAFFKQMQHWHGEEKVALDISTHHWKAHNGLELDRVFHIDLEKNSVPPETSLAYADVGYGLKHRLLRRLRGPRHRAYRFWEQLQLKDYKKLDDVYLEGYWNEEKYFEDIKDEIRQLYRFNFRLNERDQVLLHEIETGESVAVHVRRGDFREYRQRFPMCTSAYYQEALELLFRAYTGLKFFVFSDDLNWCKKELRFIPHVVFVDHPNQRQAYKDMFFMSRCKHQVIANSTFSWWAAWLNENPGRKIIYPNSSLLIRSSMPDEWIKIAA